MLLVRLQRLDQLPLVLLSFARGFRARPLLAFLAGESMEEKPVVPEASERGGSPPPAKKRRLLRAGREKQPGLPEEGEKRYVPPPKKRNPGVSFSDAHFAETTYYFESGLRKNNDFLRNTVHRHEPPVTAQAIEFLEENDEVVVVDKPSSLPVHPCGRFRHNTVIFILGKDYNLKELHTVHRLDRLTSGVLMFAKSAEVSKRIDQQVRQRQLEKEYVCRVLGEFPENEVTCEEPILVVSYKVGVCRVDPKGKFCKTVFQRLSYNGKTSVVKCFPYTGRTHQIRVHLQFLGHPIVNDPIYNTEVWGPEKGKGGNINKTDEELLRALVEGHISKQNLGLLDIAEEDLNLIVGNKEQDTSMNAAKSVQVTSVSVDPCNAEEPKCERECGMLTPSQNSVPQIQVPEPKSGETGSNELEDERDPLCRECKLVRPDPSPKDLVMYLHALRYKGADFEYCSKVPAWAQDDWEET
ncbi:pseudouridylate synthase RPUSD2 isoform X2 [Hemicordylus capensis]|uniref:pseudouridylate synthase RPUSD2 isoform X2 n=1 Tax=Hemicordylus capensis TaxID=884348 RepID=UPI002304A0C1|nr:pseudouridylate synthase RPUSD2 isoform X2 [Hemicordylus capensis]